VLFKSRQPRKFQEGLRNLVWPRKGFARTWHYLRFRLLRLPDTPHRIAAGVAAGVASSITPFVGLHFLVAAAIAWATRGNIIASAIGTFFGNPWTFPMIWWCTYELGNVILGVEGDETAIAGITWEAVAAHPVRTFVPLIEPMIVGAVPLALVAWWTSYLLLKGSVSYYRRRRDARLGRAQGA